MVAGQNGRTVYLPAGDWFDFWSGERHGGKQRITVKPPIEQIPLFVKAGTILPLAEPTLHTEDPASRRLTAQVYGAGPARAVLYADDGTWNPSLETVTLSWEAGAGSARVRIRGDRLESSGVSAGANRASPPAIRVRITRVR